MTKLRLVCLILLIVLLSGCTDKKTEASNITSSQIQGNSTPTFTVPEPSTVYVEIKGLMFNPPVWKVVRGTTIRWTNLDSALHVVNGDGFRSPNLNKRDVWNYTFEKTGTFEYNCSIHPSMRGSIIVE